MADTWIVTSHPYKRHASLAKATAERDRLAGKFPDREFRVMRVKSGLRKSGRYEQMKAAVPKLRDIAEAINEEHPGIGNEMHRILDTFDEREPA